MPGFNPVRRGLCAVLFATLCAHCSPLPRSPSGSQRASLEGTPIAPADPNADYSDDTLNDPETIPALDSMLLGYLKQGSFGPYRASNGSARIALWAATDDNNLAHWFSQPIAAIEKGQQKPQLLTAAPASVESVAIAAVDQGFLALFTNPSSSGTRLTAMVLEADGSLPSGAAPLLNSRSDILWIDAFSLNNQPAAVWATRQKKTATLFLAALTPTGAAVGAPISLLSGARAWQLLPWSGGLALAAIVAKTKGSSRSELKVFFYDDLGKPLSQTTVTESSGLGRDLDAAIIAGQLVVSWTQTPAGRSESTVLIATLGKDQKLLVEPHIAVQQFGAQRLIEMVSPITERSDGYLVWENIGQAPAEERRFLLARLSAKAELSEQRGALAFLGPRNAVPEFMASKAGVAAITQALPCPRLGESCSEEQAVPTYVEFDQQLRVLASEPLRLAPEQGATTALGWGLHCEKDFCTALGALATAPVPVHEIQLRARSSHFRLAGGTLPDAAPPAVKSMKLVAKSEPLAGVASTRVGSHTLLASLTYFDPDIPYKLRRSPAPDGRMGPVRSILRIQRFNNDGASMGSAKVLSYRARVVSGVHMLPAPDKRALVMWSALDKKQPEVFATLVDDQGKRLQQRMLTRTSGEVRTVTASLLKKGFLAVWIDERDGSPQLFSARLTPSVGRAAKQLQLSSGKAPVEAVSILQHQGKVWLTQIEGPPLGPQVVLLTQLDNSTGRPLGEPQPIATSSRGGLAAPQLLAQGPGLQLLWIDTTSGELLSRNIVGAKESAPNPSESETRTIGVWSESLHGFRAECDDTGCHAVLDIRDPRGASLRGVQWSDDRPTSTVHWVHRNSPRMGSEGLSLHRGSVFYTDGARGKGQLRHLSAQWR